MLAFIARSLDYNSKDVLLQLYRALVTPDLEYAVQFWFSYLRKNVPTMESVQQKFKKLIPQMAELMHEERSAFLTVNPWRATGPDGIPGCALRSCADQLAGAFVIIFKLSLLQSEVPTYFKKTTIILVPKKTHATCLNNYRPAALTSTIMKCFESNRFLADAISLGPLGGTVAQWLARLPHSTRDPGSIPAS
eukprot:g32439.t1